MAIKDQELHRVVQLIVKNVLPQKIIPFGSRARNKTRNNSDYDIFILVNNRKNTRKIEKELYYLMAKEGISIPVDLIVEKVGKFEEMKNNRYLIYNQVERFGNTLYDKEKTAPAVA